MTEKDKFYKTIRYILYLIVFLLFIIPLLMSLTYFF